MQSVKLYALNSIALILSFTKIESTLKMLLLVLSIIYTTIKIIEFFKEKE